MKIAVAGKGGVGKTTFASLLCWALKDRGDQVLAVDADPDTNFGSMLGFPDAEKIIPIIRMQELIEKRTEVREGNRSLFKLNPKVDDIPDKFMREHNGIRLIVMGTVKSAGSGCFCPEGTFLKRLLHQIVLREDEDIVVDFEAGLEHLGRGTASKFDRLIIVVEPTRFSLDSFKKIYPLAKDMGIKDVLAVANRVSGQKDIEFINSNLEQAQILGTIPYSEACIEANQTGDWESLKKDNIYKEAEKIVKILLNSRRHKSE